MKTLLVTSILSIITHLLSIPIGLVAFLLGVIKSSRCQGLKDTFNLDMKFNRFYKNDIYEFVSVIIIYAFMYDSFHPSIFVEPLDIPVTIIQILILFFLLFRGMEEKLFDKKPV